MGSMLMNITANMLGLDNAATPLGLKAMNELQQLNKQPDTASNAQIMFLVLNASGLTIIPVSIMGLRAAANAANPADVFLPILMATFVSTLVGLVLVSLIQRINLFHKIVLAYLGGTALFIASLFFCLLTSIKSDRNSFALCGQLYHFSIIIFFFLLAIRKKINLYEVFIEGAREGFEVAVKIIPYLVAMLFAIGVFRASGARLDCGWVPILLCCYGFRYAVCTCLAHCANETPERKRCPGYDGGNNAKLRCRFFCRSIVVDLSG